MTQIVGIARGALHPGAMLLKRIACGPSCLPQGFDGNDALIKPGKGVEQAAMRRDIDQRPLVMLTVDLDQRRTNGFQGLDADGLIVEEAACAAVRKLHTAQDHLA